MAKKKGTEPDMPNDTEPKDVVRKVNVEEIADGTLVLSKGLQGLISSVKSKAGLTKTLADDHARALLTNTLTSFIHIDLRFETGMRSMGEILFNLINKQDEAMQRKAIHAICEAQGIPPIEETGRKGFAMALFAKFPDMQQQVKGGKDTKGALRLSSYMAAYKATLPAPRQIGSGSTGRGNSAGGGATTEPSKKPKAASELFLRLWTNATATDQDVLTRLAGRAGIEYEDWLPKDAPPSE